MGRGLGAGPLRRDRSRPCHLHRVRGSIHEVRRNRAMNTSFRIELEADQGCPNDDDDDDDDGQEIGANAATAVTPSQG